MTLILNHEIIIVCSKNTILWWKYKRKNTIVGLFWTYKTCPCCKLVPCNDRKTTDSGGTDLML